MIAVILAGGQGTRLWPMSRKAKPKQLFEILGENPMIVDVYERLRKRFSPEDIFVSTQEHLKDQILVLLPEMQENQLLIEPMRRETGPAKAYVANELVKLGRGSESVAFIPTDHYIANIDRFLKSLEVADQLIQETGKMLDIAVVPNFPSTALGYTQIGKRIEDRDGIEVYQFLGHKEKPHYQQAKEYIESGEYLWHANYYMWTSEKFLEAYKIHAPEIFGIIEKMNQVESEENKKELFSQMPKISVDYAITEKLSSEEVLIIRGDFGWSDIGSWNILHDRLKSNDSGNVTKGNIVEVDSKNNLLYGLDKKVIATIGLNDMIVVDTPDALLICPQGRSQDVKEVIKKLKEEGFEEYL